MAITVYPVTPSFAAEIGDVDLGAPIDPTDLRGIKDAFTQYAVLIFPDQHLSQDHTSNSRGTSARSRPRLPSIERTRHCVCAKNLPTFPTSITRTRSGASKADFARSNWATGCGTRIARSSEYLRAHRCFMRGPSRRSADIPNSPMSEPRTMRFPRRRNVVSIAWWPSIQSSTLVRGSASPISAMRSGEECHRCPRWSCARSLNPGANRSTSRRTRGMPEHEGRTLIDQLTAHATQRQFIYTHRWRVNDLVMWDNRCTMHRGTEFDDLRWRRDVQRATVCDVANSCEQEGIEIAAA